ncbi:MAG: hypothetical protein HN742_25820 [Lentisphaerae bacterium]|jgi:DNA repair photolyase|nr:hypothetical protein [Lentisphaerota bacterium]MBT4820332.1 hypothetical protein [Lentisphaerota bacterium]MBT5604791.1 hypothetical protein [Lentisphaerota bacterium]MBT7057035.1 hypothetical protein [Lentisphaerota bacterium]MBT7845319.1 hypothetical protein [Lentisphaerota bacterium]
MYSLASKLYVHKDYADFPDAPARVERIESAMGQEAENFGDLDIPDLIEERGWQDRRSRRFSAFDTTPDQDVVLMLSHFGEHPNLAKLTEKLGKDKPVTGLMRQLLGLRNMNLFSSGVEDFHKPRKDHVCRPQWQLFTMEGCSHQCAYCSLGGVIAAKVNMDYYCDHLGKLIENNPWQQVFLTNSNSDTPILEPEIGHIRALLDLVKRYDNRHFVVHTKSANVDHLLEHTDHDQRAIMLWTIATPSAARIYEPGAPSTEERFAAARKCYRTGYPVRIKFKPIIPMKDWREEATLMARLALDGMKPEVINLLTLTWMDVTTLRNAFNPEDLDPEAMEAADTAKDDMTDDHLRPFPHAFRATVYDHFITEIRKIDPDVPITFSTESLDMWKQFGERLGYDARDYICGCGPQSTPGCRRLEGNPWKVIAPMSWDGHAIEPGGPGRSA